MKKSISIIGGGPSAMLLASLLDSQKYQITIYEKNKALGRKFLVAGKGGFNLTHAEEISTLKHRYDPPGYLDQVLEYFDNQALRTWMDKIGIPTFVGTSNRVFPSKGIKPIEVLKAIETQLKKNNVSVLYNHTWNGWAEDNSLLFNDNSCDTVEKVSSDISVFCLGGASWKVTGSTGQWINLFQKKGIQVIPFAPANCAYKVNWPKPFKDQYAGKPLKNIATILGENIHKGELVITDFGLEGNAIYAQSSGIQKSLMQSKVTTLLLNLKPSLSEETIRQRLSNPSSKNVGQRLKQDIKLGRTKIQLLKAMTTKEVYQDMDLLTQAIKALPVTLIAAAPIDEAISTTGGVCRSALTDDFEMKKISNQYCIGEMIDWNAPTGGYLLQACFSMGAYLANTLNKN